MFVEKRSVNTVRPIGAGERICSLWAIARKQQGVKVVSKDDILKDYAGLVLGLRHYHPGKLYVVKDFLDIGELYVHLVEVSTDEASLTHHGKAFLGVYYGLDQLTQIFSAFSAGNGQAFMSPSEIVDQIWAKPVAYEGLGDGWVVNHKLKSSDYE